MITSSHSRAVALSASTSPNLCRLTPSGAVARDIAPLRTRPPPCASARFGGKLRRTPRGGFAHGFSGGENRGLRRNDLPRPYRKAQFAVGRVVGRDHQGARQFPRESGARRGLEGPVGGKNLVR